MANFCLEIRILFLNFLKKAKIVGNLSGKIKEIEIFRKFPSKNQNFSVKLPEKSKFFGNLPGKSNLFLPGSTTPQMSNRIDAAGFGEEYSAAGAPSLLICLINNPQWPIFGRGRLR